MFLAKGFNLIAYKASPDITSTMTDPDLDGIKPKTPKLRLWHHITPLVIFAVTWWIVGFDVDTHLAISAMENIVEYRPRLTLAAVIALGMSICFLILYYRYYFRRGERWWLDRKFFLLTVALPLLAGLAEYAAVQYRLEANNYERCYAYDLDGDRIRSPFFEEIVEKQKWLRDGGCTVGSWSED